MEKTLLAVIVSTTITLGVVQGAVAAQTLHMKISIGGTDIVGDQTTKKKVTKRKRSRLKQFVPRKSMNRRR